MDEYQGDSYSRHKRRYLLRKKLKLCSSCGKVAVKDSTKCNSCTKKENTRQRTQRRELKNKGICPKCRQVIPEGEPRCKNCRKKINIRTRVFRRLRIAAGLCISCGSPVDTRHQHCLLCKAKISQNYQVKKILVFNAYGGCRCVCCGETTVEFLQLDHINGGGSKHRKILKADGTRFYDWLIKNHFPDGYRVLCANCNSAYGCFGCCPHQLARQSGLDLMINDQWASTRNAYSSYYVQKKIIKERHDYTAAHIKRDSATSDLVQYKNDINANIINRLEIASSYYCPNCLQRRAKQLGVGKVSCNKCGTIFETGTINKTKEFKVITEHGLFVVRARNRVVLRKVCARNRISFIKIEDA